MESQGTYVGFWVGVARIKKMGLDELSQTPPIINNDIYFKVDLTQFSNRLNMVCERKRVD